MELEAVDELLPGKKLGRGVIHEVLWEGKNPRPFFFAAWMARMGGKERHEGTEARRHEATKGGKIVWCDPRGEVYPPGLLGVGISFSEVLLLRPWNAEEEIWALGECLGCKGVGVTVAQPPVLSRVVARRLQLAAERGGGVGILMRRMGAASLHHAAATRWLVEPARGERTVQRWKIQLIHGHGGRLHKPVYLECSREFDSMHRVRAVEELVGGSGEKVAATRHRRSG